MLMLTPYSSDRYLDGGVASTLGLLVPPDYEVAPDNQLRLWWAEVEWWLWEDGRAGTDDAR